MPVLGVDCEVSDLPGDRVDDYAAYLTPGSIGAIGVGSDLERHRLRHSRILLSFLGLWQAQPAAPPNSRAADSPHLPEHSLGQW
jgi:hypothetical protein